MVRWHEVRSKFLEESLGLLLLLLFLFVNNFGLVDWMRKWEFVIWNNSFNNACVQEVNAWCQTHYSFGIVKHSVEVPEERLSNHKLVVIVEHKWNEAFALCSNVNHKRLRLHLDVVSVVEEEIDGVVP